MRTLEPDTSGQAIRRNVASFKIIDALALAASPTFALMALLTGVLGSDPAVALCSAAHASPLNGMGTMYLLMSAFHMTPWVRLVRGSV
ncbi:hypothetical protein V1291_004504 [Nitrobacteraceae bacterium AZCC 1564]